RHNMLEKGLWTGFLHAFDSPRISGITLPIQAGFAFYLFGPDRFYAIVQNFALFALLLITVAHTVRTITGSWPFAYVGIGLLLATQSRFMQTGGMTDYRADGMASSLYGITLCCFLLSDWLRDKKWTRITLVSAISLVWVRPICIAYL